MTELVYTDAYGDVSKQELASCRKHNVSPSDLATLREVYGEDEHDTIALAIKKFTRNGQYQEYDMIQAARENGSI